MVIIHIRGLINIDNILITSNLEPYVDRVYIEAGIPSSDHVPICLRLLMHQMLRAFSLAIPSAGKSMAAKTEIMAMTTNNSINVNP